MLLLLIIVCIILIAERETSGKKRIRLSQPVAALRPPSSASDTSATKTNQMGAKSSAPKEFGSRHRGEKDSSTQYVDFKGANYACLFVEQFHTILFKFHSILVFI